MYIMVCSVTYAFARTQSEKSRMKIRNLIFLLAAIAVAFSLPGLAFFNVTPAEAQAAPATGFVRVTHAVAGAPEVDIWLNNDEKPAVTKLAFGKATSVLVLPARAYNVAVRAAGAARTDAPLFRGTFSVQRDLGVEVVALGAVDGRGAQAPRISSFRVDFRNTAGKARVYVIHGSPDAPAVDVLAGDAPVVRNLRYLSATTQPLNLDPGEYDLKVVPARATEPVVIDLPKTAVKADHIYTVIAIGKLAEIKPLVLVALQARQPAAPSAAQGTIRVTHASPGAPAVDIYLDGARTPAIANLAFGKSTDLIKLDAKTYAVAIRPAGAAPRSAPAFEGSLTVARNATTEVVAIGKLGGEPGFALGTYKIARSGIPAEEARIYVLHAAPAAPGVDVYANGKLVIPNLTYGNLSSALDVEKGAYRFTATVAGSRSPVVLFLPETELAPATVYTVIAYGDPLVQKPLVLAAPAVSDADEGKTATIRITHAANAGPVDVYLNNSVTPTLTNFAPGASSDVLTLLARRHSVQIRPTGQSPVNLPLYETTITLAPGRWYEAVAIGTPGGEQAFKVDLLPVRNSYPQGKARLHVYHASTAAPAVDVLVNGKVALPNFKYGVFTADPIVVDPGIFNFAVVAPGQRSPVLTRFTQAEIAPDTVYVLIAYGNPIKDKLLPITRTFPGNVRITHAVENAPAVDIYLDGALAVPGLEFGKSTDFVSLPAKKYAVAIRPAGAAADSAPVFETELTVASGISAEVVALGVLGGKPAFTLGVFPINRYPTNGKARVYVVHAAPTAGAVNITVNGANAVEGLAFPKYTAAGLEVDPATYDIYAVATANPKFFVASMPGTALEADTIYTVIAYGDPVRSTPLVLTAGVRN